MDTKKVTKKLNQRYPGKSVIVSDPSNPTELICETEPTENHPDWSEVIAVVDSIRPHYHKILTETYEVLKGELFLYLDKKKKVIVKGQKAIIKPNIIHWAEG